MIKDEYPPIWLTALTRVKNKEMLKGEKGDLWICGLDKEQPWCKETKCFYCKRICYYTEDSLDLIKKDAKKICPFCALEKYDKDISNDIRNILNKIIEKEGN